MKSENVTWGLGQALAGIFLVLAINIFLSVALALFASAKIISLPNPFAAGATIFFIYFLIFWMLAFFSRKNGLFNWEELGFRDFPIFKSIAIAIFFMFVIVFADYFWAAFLQAFKIKPPRMEFEIIKLFGRSAIGLATTFFIIVIVAPFVEEMFFRGFLYQIFKKKINALSGKIISVPPILGMTISFRFPYFPKYFGVAAAILTSAIIFGLFHFSNIIGFPIFVLIGILLAFLFERYNSLGPSIILHSVNNFFFFIILVLIARS